MSITLCPQPKYICPVCGDSRCTKCGGRANKACISCGTDHGRYRKIAK